MKKNKQIKIALLPLLLPAYLSIAFVVGQSVNDNSLTNSTQQVSTSLDDSASSVSDSSSYAHTNYFAFPTTNLPGNLSSYNVFAQTNFSMITQTNTGVLGLTNDNKTIMFTSYSGQVIWVQSLSSNSLLKTFATNNSMTAANLEVQEWVFLSNNSNRNWVAFLITDGTKQAIVTIDLDTGLFAPDNVNDNLVLNGDNVFKIVSTDNSYNRIFQIGGNSLVLLKSNWTDSPKLITYDYTNKIVNQVTLTLNYSNSSTRELASLIYTGGKTYAYTINKTGTVSGTKTNFNQYLELVSLDTTTNILTIWNETSIGNSYVVDGTNTTLSNIDNFKNVYFYKKTDYGTNFYLLSGSLGNNYIEVYSISGNTLAKKSSVALSGYTINSITYNSNLDKMYIANNKSSNNVYLSWIDLSSTNPQLSIIQQSTDSSEKKYFLIPILESTSKEYLIQLSKIGSNIPSYMTYSGSSYTNTNTSMAYATWWFNSSSKDISTDMGIKYTPDGVTLDLIKSYININNTRGIASQGSKVANDTNGTLEYTLKISYSASYDSSVSTYFNITFYIQGLAKSSSYIFNWIDVTSTGDLADKAKKIEELKKVNYANKITAQQILDNFINYTILDKNGNQVTITASMISLSYSADYGTLTISVNLSSLNLPIGTASSKINFSKQYTGFLSTSGYSVSSKTDSQINTFTKTIYPSKLTKEEIVNNFLSTTGLENSVQYWDITITNADDYNGTVTISASYNGAKSQITNSAQLPESYFTKFSNIITNKTFGGFKSISSNSSLFTKPTMTDLTSTTNQNTYLPSEIWNQYLEYLNGDTSINKNDVILLNNLKYSLTNVDDLIIDTKSAKVIDTESSTDEYSQGYIEFNVTLKTGVSTNIDYDGAQYTSNDGKLVITNNLLDEIGYPYTIKWNINTYNKFFVIKDSEGHAIIAESPNVYEVNLDNDENTFYDINKNEYSNEITTEDISRLIDAKGYNYSISLESDVNKGYVKATINLSLQDKPLTSSDLTNNLNFTKTIIIYNFKVPMSETAVLSMLAAICFASSAAFVLLISQISWLTKKIKYKVLLKNSKDLDVREKKLENLTKKKRYFKD